MVARDLITERMNKRLEKFYSPIALILGEEYDKYWVAGSSCNKDKPNDYDVYSPKSFNFDAISEHAAKMNLHTVSVTKNAVTVIINDTPVQFCNYPKLSLKSLIDSFDFAHVQVGVEITTTWDDGVYSDSRITECCMTEDYKDSMIVGSTWYTGSEYPLSSMIRLVKYAKRDCFLGNSYKVSQIQILNDIVRRGFKDYNDFKDQLEAIDILLLGENEANIASELFATFQDRGLVES